MYVCMYVCMYVSMYVCMYVSAARFSMTRNKQRRKQNVTGSKNPTGRRQKDGYFQASTDERKGQFLKKLCGIASKKE